MKSPKDPEKYLSPLVAGARLIDLALRHVLCLREGIRIRWEVKLRYYYTPDYVKDPKAIIRTMSGEFSSGTDPDIEIPPEKDNHE